MPRQPRNPRSAEDFSHGPDLDRNWTRPGPDDQRSGDEKVSRPPRTEPRDGVDRPDDYGKDDVRPQPHERSIAEAFGFSVPRNYPYPGMASAERRGRFFGVGPKGYRRSDERIREEVSDRLMTNPDIDPSDIDVRVANGVVTLSGTVEDRHEKRLAEYIAEDALGVNDVENRLKVRHGFWAAVTGERATEKELPTRATREGEEAASEAGRASSARNAARRDAEAR